MLGAEDLPSRFTLARHPARYFSLSHAGASIRFRILTKLYTATPKVNIQPTRSVPRCLVFRSIPTVFSQPKISSTRFLFRWLIGYPAWRVVRLSIALALFFVFWAI